MCARARRSPGDRQAVPGVMEVMKSGKTKFQVGSNQNLFDWTYVDNVVHAHLLAAEKLADRVPLSVLDDRLLPIDLSVPRRQLPTSRFRPPTLVEREKEADPQFENYTEPDPPLPAIRNRFDPFANANIEQTCPNGAVDREKETVAVAGQAYFVTNGEPIAFWDFPRAVWKEYNGHVAPWVVPLPVPVGLTIAALAEGVMGLLGKTPNMTQGKVVYSTVNRFYNIEKVRRGPWLLRHIFMTRAYSSVRPRRHEDSSVTNRSSDSKRESSAPWQCVSCSLSPFPVSAPLHFCCTETLA
jgi:sterol-4alpha-carboxylate 3-dehydrogenase (decarboxylating)